jgi:hypothetical protein
MKWFKHAYACSKFNRLLKKAHLLRRETSPEAREEDMKKSKSSISKARSYAEIGEFWDEQDLSDYWTRQER